MDIKAFQQEIKQKIYSPPPKFESGTLILACEVNLPNSVVDILCHPSSPSPSSITPSPTPSPSSSPFITSHEPQVIEAAM